MSIHVCKCGDEFHLRYPGMTEDQAQNLASTINKGIPTTGGCKTSVCQAATVDGVCCPAESCDLEDGTRTWEQIARQLKARCSHLERLLKENAEKKLSLKEKP